jgi:hypothetical protein
VDCRFSLHRSKLGHRVPRLVLRPAPQDLGASIEAPFACRIPDANMERGIPL